jgi:hypothetical protein
MRPGRFPSGRCLALAFAVSGASVSPGLDARATAQVPPAPVAQCAIAPLPCALSAGKLRLDVAARRLAWKWSARGVVDLRDLSHPTIGTGYDLCLYDASDAVVLATGVPPAGVCNGKACWRARPWGFQYRDHDALTGGISKIVLHALGRHDRFSVKGEGDLLPLPVTEPVLPLTVQLVRTDDPTQCWASSIDELR